MYTLGNIGRHKIVSTKLPAVGHTREALTAAGNTTTRLLGTFQKVRVKDSPSGRFIKYKCKGKCNCMVDQVYVFFDDCSENNLLSIT